MEKNNTKPKNNKIKHCEKCFSDGITNKTCAICNIDICMTCDHCSVKCNYDNKKFRGDIDTYLEIIPKLSDNDKTRYTVFMFKKYMKQNVKLCKHKKVAQSAAEKIPRISKELFCENTSEESHKNMLKFLCLQDSGYDINPSNNKQMEQLKKAGIIKFKAALQPVLDLLCCLGIYKRNVLTNDNIMDSKDFRGQYVKVSDNATNICPLLYYNKAANNLKLIKDLQSLNGYNKIKFLLKHQKKLMCWAKGKGNYQLHKDTFNLRKV